MSGIPSSGENSIVDNGPNDPGLFQVNQGQLVLQDNAYVNLFLDDTVHQNNIISASDTTRLVYTVGGSEAKLQRNWWGFAPDGCPPYGNIREDQADAIFYRDNPPFGISYENALCSQPSIPSCDTGCGETGSIALRSEENSPGFASLPRWVFPRSQPSNIQNARNALRSFRQNLMQQDITSAYSILTQLIQVYLHDPRIMGFISSAAFHSELDYTRTFPSSVFPSMTRLGSLLCSAINIATNDSVKAVLRESLCYVYARAGDVPSAEQSIATVRTSHSGSAIANRILWLKLLCAMARRDTSGVHFTIGEMLSAGYSSGQVHIAYAMREGFFRFKSRPLSFPKLSLPLIDTAKASGDRIMSTAQPELTIYPNPTTGTATMRYSIPVDGYVSLTLYSILGIPVSTLVDGYHSAGVHQFVLRSIDGRATIPPGLYFCMLRTQTGQRTVSVLIR